MALDFLDPALDAAVSHDASAQSFTQPLTVNVRMPDGGWLSMLTAAGTSVGEALTRFGVPVRRAGHGGDARGLPSARLQSSWRQGAGDDGTRVLSDLLMTPDLDGVALELPWDAIELQTSWVAG